MSENSKPANLVRTEHFGSVQTVTKTETSALAMAEQTKAMVAAHYICAVQNPRSWLNVRSELMADCERPRFAEAARYKRPQGRVFNKDTREWEDNFVEGFSIRFAEAALRSMKNMSGTSTVIYEDASQLIVLVSAIDYQNNSDLSEQVIVAKTVERKKLKDGQVPLSWRINSSGDKVFLVEATDEEVNTKKQALVSKALRNCILRLLPADIKEDCEERIATTKAKADADDPLAATKRVMDAFAKQRVKPSDIAQYLGHEPDDMSPAERDELRGVYQAMQEGLSWRDALEAKVGTAPSDDPDAKKKEQATKDLISKARTNQQKKGAGKPAEQKPAAQATQEPADKPKSNPKAAETPATPAAAAAPVEQAAEQPRMRESGEEG